MTLVACSFACATASADHSLQALISTGPSGGNLPVDATFGGASADGSRVYFTTKESLVATDTDGRQDVYERFGTTTTLISTGPSGGNGAFDAFYNGNSADGSRVFFTTSEILTAADTDAQYDIYQRSGGGSTLISAGDIGGNGAFAAYFEGASSDGARVYFTTDEQLHFADNDATTDVYQRTSGSGTTSFLSLGPTGGSGAFPASFDGASQDGSHVFIRTYEQLVSGDTDSQADIYDRSGTTTTLISTGPINGNSPYNALFGGSSADGTHVFFTTQESLVNSDSDTTACIQLDQPTPCVDVYERSGSTTSLISTGPAATNAGFDAGFGGASQDGTRVFFTTGEQLVNTDTDSSVDVYQRSSGSTTQVSVGSYGGNAAKNASYVGSSQDGTHVFFQTDESLDGGDGDGRTDVYDRYGGATALISTGNVGGNAPFDASFAGASIGGWRVFFTTDESLVSADTDGRRDVYERFAGAATLISTGPVSGFNLDNYFTGSSIDGTRVFFRTSDRLVPADTDNSSDVYQSRAVPYQMPGSATAVNTSLVPVFKQCGTGGNPANGKHAPPFGVGSCGPATSATAAHVGAQSTGSASVGAVPGNLTTAADEADVSVTATITDVRAGNPTGADYNPNPSGPDLTLAVKLRLTDLFNGSSQADPATATDFDLVVPVDCVNTAGSDGATCSTNTSTDALTPGFVGENHRTMLQGFRLRVNDAGIDGIRGNSDDKLFEQEGFFAP
jgi:hypothetical protein